MVYLKKGAVLCVKREGKFNWKSFNCDGRSQIETGGKLIDTEVYYN